MAFSYDAALGRPLDHARLGLGDTSATDFLLEDETIEAKIGLFGYVEGVAQLADALAVRVSQEPSSFGEGSTGLSIQWSQRVAAWRQLSADCRQGLVRSPFGGGASAALGQLNVPEGLL